MKEITPGHAPLEIPKKWWAGRTVHCPICKCEQELEVTDRPMKVSEPTSESDHHLATFQCPTDTIEWCCPGILIAKILIQ